MEKKWQFKWIKILLAIFTVAVAFVTLTVSVSANEIPVNDFTTLKNAINTAADGEIIMIGNDVTFSETLVINKNLTFRAENRVALTVAGSFRHFDVRKESGGDITLEFTNVELIGRKNSNTDTTAGGGIIITRTVNSPALANTSNTINTLYLINAVIKNCYNTSPYYGGAISFTWPQGQVEIGGYCNLDISGQKTDISNNSSSRGGAVSANHITLNGGTISYNTASDRGGGIYAYSGFTMNGGAIINNAAIYGGGVQDYPYGEIIINDGTISDNIAEYGGGIHSNAEYITITGGNLARNSATKYGGGIYGGHVTIGSGVISGNAAGLDGGGVYAGSGFAMNSGEIIDNGASENGGGVYVSVWNPDFNFSDTATYVYNAISPIHGGVIHNNTAGIYGAGIYVGKVHYNEGDFGLIADVDFISTLDIRNGIISGNNASNGGGGIYAEAGGAIITDSTISDNATMSQDTGNGGGIYAANDSVIHISNTVIDKNSAGLDGGGIWIANLNNLTTNGVKFTDNKASKGYIWNIDAPDIEQQVDAAIHQANILNTTYTIPFTNSYNNYDVNYATGTLLLEGTIPPMLEDTVPPPTVIPPVTSPATPAAPSTNLYNRIIGTPNRRAVLENEPLIGDTVIIEEEAVPLAPAPTPNPNPNPSTGRPMTSAIPVALLLCAKVAWSIKKSFTPGGKR